RPFSVDHSAPRGPRAVAFRGLRFTPDGNTFVSFPTLARPTASLTITSGTGTDSATVSALSPAFNGVVITYSGGVVTAHFTDGNDTVTVAKNSGAADGAPIVDP